MKISNWCLSGEEVDHPQNVVIHKIFEDLVEDQPGLKEKVALVNAESGTSITFRELNEKSNRIARIMLENIRKNGLKANSDGDYIVAYGSYQVRSWSLQYWQSSRQAWHMFP